MGFYEDDFKDQPFQDDPEELDMILENENLKMDLEDIHGMSFHDTTQLDPYLENQFLRKVKAYEQSAKGPRKLLIDLFHKGFEFPAVRSMTKKQLTEKIAGICSVLEEHNVVVELRPGVPEEVVYDYLINQALTDSDVVLAPGFTFHLDGCNGQCPDCFQNPYCDIVKEMWPEE